MNNFLYELKFKFNEFIYDLSGVLDSFYSIVESFKNLIIWFPIIFKDRQFDYQYMYLILHKKIELMEEMYLNENLTFSDNNLKIADELWLVKERLEKLIEDDYFDMARGEDVESFTEVMDMAEYMRNVDKEFVFNYMRDHVETWWD